MLCIVLQAYETSLSFVFYTFTLDYVEETFQTYLKASMGDLRDAAQRLKEKSPAPMNEMLQKEPRDEALRKREERSKMIVRDVPPTTPGKNSSNSI